jgi:hypothetical protein
LPCPAQDRQIFKSLYDFVARVLFTSKAVRTDAHSGALACCHICNPLPSPPSSLQDRQFFESLYDFVARVLFTCIERKRWHAIENEMGRIFRSEHFNLARVRVK